jgi:2,3-bisphosphoglycerate-independent phosphoglycerate mutase
MKYLFLIAEGIPDFPSRKFDDRTPLEIARTPFLDALALEGCSGTCKPIPGSHFPGSDTGFLSLTGNPPSRTRGGRGHYEAVGLGIDLSPEYTPFRVNLSTIEDGFMLSYGCDTISDDECVVLAKALNRAFRDIPAEFYPLAGYRMVLVVRNDWLFEGERPNLKTMNPREHMRFSVRDNYPRGNGREKLVAIMERAARILSAQDINRVKIDLGENPANGIWIWGNGLPARILPFDRQFPVRGFCIPGSHLIRGIALSIGLETSSLIKAHGDPEPAMSRRVETAIRAFEVFDLVILHLETINDVSREGNIHKKCQIIERFDEKVVGRLLEYLKSRGEYRILVASSHAAGVDATTPSRIAVPWVLSGTGIEPDKCRFFNEREALSSRFLSVAGHKLLKKTLFRK